jgi:MFS family permease
MSSTTTRRKSNTFYVILIAGAATLGGFLFGFDTAVINGAVTAISKAFNANSVQIGLAVSLALLGSCDRLRR